MSQKAFRISCLALCLTLALLLTACGGNSAGNPPPGQEDTQAADAASQGEDDAASEEETEDAPAADPGGPMAEGYPYRDFTATLTTGESFTLSDHEGKVILLNFWATWCGPCVVEMPAFPRLEETFGEDLVLVAVNCGEDEGTVTDFLTDNGYAFRVVLDPEYEVNYLYPSDGIPYTLIIGPDGTVAHITLGAYDADTMYEMYSEQISALLA